MLIGLSLQTVVTLVVQGEEAMKAKIADLTLEMHKLKPEQSFTDWCEYNTKERQLLTAVKILEHYQNAKANVEG